MDFIKQHWVEIMAVVSFLHIAAKLIVGLTPNPTDNAFLEKAVALIKQIASIAGLQPSIPKILENNTSITKKSGNP